MHGHVSTLRICGLSNPNHALNRVEKAMSDGDLLGSLLSRFSDTAYEIVRGDGEEKLVDFKSSCVLLPSGLPLSQNEGLYLEGASLMNEKIFGYSFRHLFIKNGPSGLAPFMSCIEIDKRAISEYIKKVGEKEFISFEKALGLIFSMANHDSTTHAYGIIAGGGKRDYLNDILRRNLGFDIGRFSTGEVAAAAFHRDMFEEIDELQNTKLPLLKMVVHNARILLSFIQQILENGDEDLKVGKYWESVLKYPLFSLLDPDGVEIDKLRKDFPHVALKPTEWGRSIHRNQNECNISPRTNETISVSLRDIRTTMMQCYRKGINTKSDLARLLAANGDYPITQDWDELELMMVARKFGVSLTTSEEILEIHEARQRLLNRNPFAESWDPLGDYKEYIEIKHHGLDTSSWDDKNEWKKLFINDIEKKIQAYKRTGMNIDEAEEISIYITRLRDDYGFDIDENNFPDFLRARKERFRMILKGITAKNGKSSFFSPITIFDEFIHLKKMGYTDSEIESLFESCNIEISEEDRQPF